MAKSDDWTIQDEINDVKIKRPHVVLLGAGASVAALPKGDKNGRRLPVMDNFVEVVGLAPILKKLGIANHSQNFETLYSDLIGDPSHANAVLEIEKCVRDYFSLLELPDHPTVYDHLVLSLREKDLIATFNWDPFLFQACIRNCRTAKPPRTTFLHGCVALGVDIENKITGPVGRLSSKGKLFEPSKILFPIKKKDYNSDPFISSEWKTLKNYLKHAYVFSIFGYGAPASDVEAVALMKEAWGDVKKREYEETEMIDIKSEKILTKSWKGFIHTHHYQKWDSFYESTIGTHPRRSCEATWNRLMECKWLDLNPIPKEMNFPDLYNWLQPFFDVEAKQKSSQKS
jgi:hypothetical protein